MSAPRIVVPLDAAGHRAVQALLPWYAAGSLDAADRACVEAHLAECVRCQTDLAFERRLCAAQRAAPTAPDAVERGLARLAPRLAVPARGGRLAAVLGRALDAWRSLGRGPRWLVAGQALAIAALAAALALPGAGDGRYRALGAAPSPAAGNVLLRLGEGASAADLAAAARGSGARVVDGPTAAGAWLLAVPPARRDAALAALRSQPAVTLAAPVEQGGAP